MMYLNETDKVNNLTKLARHRIAARAIALNPELIDRAYEALDVIEEKWGYVPAHDEWRVLLRREPAEIRRALTARTEEMDRLRIDSPFNLLSQHGLDFTDEVERRRIWWIAKRVAGVSSQDEAWTRTPDYEARRQTWWNVGRPAAAEHAPELDEPEEDPRYEARF